MCNRPCWCWSNGSGKEEEVWHDSSRFQLFHGQDKVSSRYSLHPSPVDSTDSVLCWDFQPGRSEPQMTSAISVSSFFCAKVSWFSICPNCDTIIFSVSRVGAYKRIQWRICQISLHSAHPKAKETSHTTEGLKCQGKSPNSDQRHSGPPCNTYIEQIKDRSHTDKYIGQRKYQLNYYFLGHQKRYQNPVFSDYFYETASTLDSAVQCYSEHESPEVSPGPTH